MDLDALRLFVRVYELKNFSKAATVLGMTQPNISRVISDLEHRCGGPLFHRTGRGVAATKLGEMLFPRAQSMIMESDQLLADVRSRHGRLVGEVAVGLSSVMPRNFIVELYRVLAREAPGIRLRLREGFSDQVEKWVAEGAVDIGMPHMYRKPKQSEDEVLLTDILVLVRPKDAPALPQSIPFDRLSEFPLILPSLPNGTRVIISDTARRRSVPLNIAIEVDSLAAHFALVDEAGLYSILGTSALTSGSARGEFASSLIVRPQLSRPTVLKTTRQRPLSLAAREVIKHIRAIAKSWSALAA